MAESTTIHCPSCIPIYFGPGDSAGKWHCPEDCPSKPKILPQSGGSSASASASDALLSPPSASSAGVLERMITDCGQSVLFGGYLPPKDFISDVVLTTGLKSMRGMGRVDVPIVPPE
jgi:hypothetical protein